jgi:hypothetical protein
MKVSDVRKRRRLAAQVASGELSLAKLRLRIEGRPTLEDAGPASPEAGPDGPIPEGDGPALETVLAEIADAAEAEADATALEAAGAAVSALPAEPEEAAMPGIDEATEHLARAINELAIALQTDSGLAQASGHERQQFAKYLTIAKIKLENAITVVRSGNTRGLGGGGEPDL